MSERTDGWTQKRCTLKGEFKSFTRWKISGFSPTSHLAHVQIWSDPGPFQSACASFRQGGFQHEDFWEVGRFILWAGLPSLLWHLRILSAHVWCERAPWPQEWKICSLLIFHSRRAQLLSASALFLSWSVYRRQIPGVKPRVQLPPVSILSEGRKTPHIYYVYTHSNI